MNTHQVKDSFADLLDDDLRVTIDFEGEPSYYVDIPDDETVVDEEKLEKFLKKHLGKEMNIRYQSAKASSGAKWRKLKLLEYDFTYFRCASPDNPDRVFTYRRDRVLEIGDEPHS